MDAISPIDGRYVQKTKILRQYFSEFALMKKRLFVELYYLKALEKGNYLSIHDEFDVSDFNHIKSIEKTTQHDLKAVEYFLREQLPKSIWPWIHFGLTSEDVNNVAYTLLIKSCVEEQCLEQLTKLVHYLDQESHLHAKTIMLARTHGQPATPTSFGKELKVFEDRLQKQITKLKEFAFEAKFGGAVGTWSAHYVALPQKDWKLFSREMLHSLGLSLQQFTTQIAQRENIIELFQIMSRINGIIIDLNQDLWWYMSLNYVEKELHSVGSSTMPHKSNPILFENSEGNLILANSLLRGFDQLQQSRLQRDLRDSTLMRNIGVAFAHSYLGWTATLSGLEQLTVNKKRISKELHDHAEILLEAVQTVMRANGITDAYEQVKNNLGSQPSLSQIRHFIQQLAITSDDKKKLMTLTPETYYYDIF